MNIFCGFEKYNRNVASDDYFSSLIRRNQLPAYKTYIGKYSHPLILSHKTSNPNTLPTTVLGKNCGESKLVIVVSWIYSLAVFSVIVWYTIDRDYVNIYYSIIPIVQYIGGIIYHSTDHFENLYEKHKKYNFDLVCVILPLIVLQMAVFFSMHTYKWHEYISIFYIITTITTFTAEFWFILYKHCRILNDFTEKLSHDKTPMNVLLRDLTEIKFDLDTSISVLKNSFGITSILGAIPVGYLTLCLKNGNCEKNFPWMNTCLFLFYQFVFFMFIRFIENRKDEINRIVKHNNFIDKYIIRMDNRDIAATYNNEAGIIALIRLEENATSIDWMLFNTISSGRWSQFSILGMNLSDGEIFKLGALIVGIILLIQKYS